MPTGSPSPLSTEQIDQLRAELADGRRPMVWFTPAAVGVDAGRSAKVVALTEPYDGDFIQVRPTGSHDELSFSPNELTMDKPPRRRKGDEPVKLALAPVPTSAPPPMDELLVVRERPSRKAAVAKEPAVKEAIAKPVEPTKGRPAAKGRTKPPAPITVTLSSTAEGEWTVEVQAGSRRTVRPQPVGAGAVAQAARALGGDIETAIEGAITAAREQQRARVEILEAELAAARQALDELNS
ncbi:MAG TPA: DUF6319 family protein [Pseudonocardiaceae bacterium]|nr:DUF6319 family protein [Pseudonocardiaceae bacterium]